MTPPLDVCNGLDEMWAGPLACLSLPFSRLRPDTPIWKLALASLILTDLKMVGRDLKVY